jgi:hypothetical protein
MADGEKKRKKSGTLTVWPLVVHASTPRCDVTEWWRLSGFTVPVREKSPCTLSSSSLISPSRPLQHRRLEYLACIELFPSPEALPSCSSSHPDWRPLRSCCEPLDKKDRNRQSQLVRSRSSSSSRSQSRFPRRCEALDWVGDPRTTLRRFLGARTAKT